MDLAIVRCLPTLLAWSLCVAGAAAQDAIEAYEDRHAPLLDGTLGGAGDLAEDEAPHSGLFRFDTALEPWDRLKSDVQARTGIRFGGSWGVMWQNFSDEGRGERDAVGQKFTLNFSRDMWRAGTPEALVLDVVVEDRGPLGTEYAPLQAGILAGSIVPTAATWGDFNLGITQLYIRQNLFDNRFQYTIGKIFAPNFIDSYPFFDDNRQFFNQSFSTSPTIPAPLRGFGAVGAWYPTDGGLYLKGGIYTANSSDTNWTINSVFDESEFFYQAEVGWSGLARTGTPIHARGPMDQNNVHLTFWYKDEQKSGPVTNRPQAEGVAFNANFMAGDNLMWFVRAGHSEGWVTDRAVSAGFGWRPSEQFSDLFGVGLAWARPSNDLLREQYTGEVFYRLHVTPNLAITPDLQFVHNPALNPDVDTLWVAGLRARLTF